MKPSFQVLIRMLAGGSLGFIAAVALVRLTAGTSSHPPPLPPQGASLAESGNPVSAPSITLPAAGTFPKMEPREKLACSLRLRGLSPDQRLAFLQECLQRNEPERSTFLTLLLSQWAETEPASAAEWILANLQGEASSKCIHELTRTWAARDGEALAHWVDDLMRKNPTDRAKVFMGTAIVALGQQDPFRQASLAGMESNRESTWPRQLMDNIRHLRTPEAVKAMGARLEGQVAYIDDLNELKRQFARGSGDRDIAAKNLFNQLFEDTAVAWHRMKPEECDAWLNTFPENARLVARHVIEKAETKEKEKADAAPEASPTETVGQTAPEPQAAAPPPRPDPAAPAAGSVSQQVSAWQQWWRTEPEAAEAFLNSAVWPGDLKFKARAKAYASAP